MQFADGIGHLDDLRRLDESGLARGGFVVDKAREGTLVGGFDRNEHLTVADDYRSVAVGKAVLLGLPQNGQHPL